MTLDEATRRLERWTHSLLDLVPRDRLIDRADADEVIAVGLDPVALAAALRAGRSLGVVADAGFADDGATDALAAGFAPAALADAELAQRLVACARASRRAAAEGDHVTWLALGALWWSGAGDARVRRAPLLLMPVELRRGGSGGFALAAAGAVRFNRALIEAVRREAEIELGDLAEVAEPIDVGAAIEAIGARIAELRPAWAIERAAYVTAASLAGVATWNDLMRAEHIAAGPLFRRMLSTDAPAALPPLAPPVLALDADAEQGRAVAAALAGHSVVVLAPPGTGAGQTAANLTAAALADGKTVLVVANRTAALASVRRHLAALGVADFALALDTLADGKRVAAALASTADRSWRPGAAALGAIDRRDQVGAALDGYAAALHAPTLSGITMYAAVARLIELRTSPRLAPTAIDLAGLSAAELARRQVVLADYARAATAVAPVAAHPWRASALPELPGDADTAEVGAALDAVAAATEEVDRRLVTLARLIPGLAPRSRADLDAAGKLFAIAAKTPRPGADLIAAGPAPHAGETVVDPTRALPATAIPRDPASYVALARRQRKLRDELAQRWTPAVTDLDLDGLATRFRAWDGRFGLWRWAALRGARAEVREVFAADGKLPADLTIAADLDTAAEERAARRLLGEAAGPARRWFGELAGVRDAADLPDLDALDLDEVDAALWWARELRAAFDAVPVDGSRDAAWRSLVAQVCAPHVAIALRADAGADSTADAAFADAAAAVDAWHKAVATLAEAAGIDAGAIDRAGPVAPAAPDAVVAAFGRPGVFGGAPIARAAVIGGSGYLAALAEQVAAWRAALAHLPRWTDYVRARSAARAAGLAPVVAACESGELATDQAADAWERALLLAVIGDRLANAAPLAQFHGPSHHARAAELADLTRAAQLAVRSRTLVRLAERVPRRSPGKPDLCDPIDTELAAPVARGARELLVDAAPALPTLAPCVLATPAAVAEHLDPTLPAFDLVILLEAGAIPTATALGTLARARTAAIFGTPGEDGTLYADAAARFPVVELVTHYRSRHEALIAFASERWFGDRLRIAPAAAASPKLGLAWRAIEGDPADAVVGATLAHLRDAASARRSLAVIGFDRELLARVEDRLDAARALDPAIDRACAGPDGDDRPEPILIAEASVAHGDARDVVIVAIDGVPPERALATAITRAREQVIVMSPAFAPEAEAASEAGVAVTAEAVVAVDDAWGPDTMPVPAATIVAPSATAVVGPTAAALIDLSRRAGDPTFPDAAPAGPLTAAIAAALTTRGWIIRHQIGIGPIRIELAVVDPDDPTRHVLAIETDGAAYAAFSAAGDRDRLRAQLLTALGWRLHRIWCLDWWTDPEREAQRAHGAVIAAIAAVRQTRRLTQPRITPRWPRPDSGPVDTAVPEAAASGIPTSAPLAAGSAPRAPRGSRPTGAKSPQLLLGLAGRMSPPVAPYQAASVPCGRRRPDDMFEARHAAELGTLIDRVLEVEAPIHLALLARRVGAYFGVGKVTPAITDQIRGALEGHGQFGPEPDVIWRLDQDPTAPTPVRVAAEAIESRRDIDEVPLVEIAGAAAVVVERVHTVPLVDLVRDAARLLGFSRITDRVTDRVKVGVALAGETGTIKLDGDRATR